MSALSFNEMKSDLPEIDDNASLKSMLYLDSFWAVPLQGGFGRLIQTLLLK